MSASAEPAHKGVVVSAVLGLSQADLLKKGRVEMLQDDVHKLLSDLAIGDAGAEP